MGANPQSVGCESDALPLHYLSRLIDRCDMIHPSFEKNDHLLQSEFHVRNFKVSLLPTDVQWDGNSSFPNDCFMSYDYPLIKALAIQLVL